MPIVGMPHRAPRERVGYERSPSFIDPEVLAIVHGRWIRGNGLAYPANYLGISVRDVKASLHRLRRAGLVVVRTFETYSYRRDGSKETVRTPLWTPPDAAIGTKP